MIINENYLVFLKIYEEKSLSKTAEKLDIYQGALSKLLKKLETQLDEKLFLRTNRGLVPTDYAKKLYLQVKKQNLLWSTFDNSSDLNTLSGSIKVGGHPVLLNQYSDKFSELIKKYENLDLKFMFMRSADVTRHILNFDLEFGLVVNPKKFNDLVLKPLRSDQVGAFTINKSYNKDVVVYNPELVNETNLAKKFPRAKRFISNANLSLSITLAKKLDCPIVIPKVIANNFGFEKKISMAFESSKVYLIYRAEQKMNFNTRLFTDVFK